MSDDIKRHIAYDPETGWLTWIVTPKNNAPIGSRIGFLNERGYRRLSLNKQYYRAHQVAWFLHYGEWPPDDQEVDHINGIPDDNRICNLRLAPHHLNSKSHRSIGAAGTSFKGISKKRRHWEAAIGFKGYRHYLGCFDSPEAAARAYDAAAREKFGEYATFNFPEEWPNGRSGRK